MFNTLIIPLAAALFILLLIFTNDIFLALGIPIIALPILLFLFHKYKISQKISIHVPTKNLFNIIILSLAIFIVLQFVVDTSIALLISFLILYYHKFITKNHSYILACVFILLAVFFLSIKENKTAEQLTINAFSFLTLGVILQLIETRKDNQKANEDDFNLLHIPNLLKAYKNKTAYAKKSK